MDNCKKCGGNKIMCDSTKDNKHFCSECGTEKKMYSLDDIYNLTKGSIYATTIIGHMERVKCVCSEGVKCTRCEIIDRMNVVIDEIGKIIYC